MINEHAITYRDKLSVEDLDYLVRKSNRLGRLGREISRVYTQSDRDGMHVYFEVDNPGIRCE